MEEATRRSILKKAVGLTVTAFGMAGAFVAGHALLRSRRSAYPTNRAQYAKRGLRVIRPPGLTLINSSSPQSSNWYRVCNSW